MRPGQCRRPETRPLKTAFQPRSLTHPVTAPAAAPVFRDSGFPALALSWDGHGLRPGRALGSGRCFALWPGTGFLGSEWHVVRAVPILPPRPPPRAGPGTGSGHGRQCEPVAGTRSGFREDRAPHGLLAWPLPRSPSPRVRLVSVRGSPPPRPPERPHSASPPPPLSGLLLHAAFSFLFSFLVEITPSLPGSRV